MNPLNNTDDLPRDDLPDEEENLWAHVTRDVRPLRKSTRIIPEKPIAPPAPRQSSSPPPDVRPTTLPGGREVDGHTGRRLKSGDYPIDLTLDLHGLTQAAAHRKLRETVLRAYGQNLRCLLVVTGKGCGQEGGAGVLKRQVPLWLQEGDLRGIVLKTQLAQPRHGGGGALYVLLRRRRTAQDQ